MPLIRPATEADCRFLAPRLRPEDVAEVRACSGEAPLDALLDGLEASSHCYTIEHEGDPIAIYGGIPHPQRADIGAPWMLATPSLVKAQVWFLRNSEGIVEGIQQHYPILWNLVDARNTVHIKWLRWCGFEFLALHPEHGVERRPFWEFVRYQNV